MRNSGRKILFAWLATALLFPTALTAQSVPDSISVAPQNTPVVMGADNAAAESKKPEKSKRRKKKELVSVSEDFQAEYVISSGGRTYIPKRTPQSDSLRVVELTARIDSLVLLRDSLASVPIVPTDTAAMINLDSLAVAMSDEQRLQQRLDELIAERELYMPKADSLTVAPDSLAIDSAAFKPRYNKLFRDSLSFSLVTAVSVAVPGFAQLYEEKYWKIPVQYAAIGVPLYFGLKQNTLYKNYENQYNDLKIHNAEQSEIEPVQAKMYRHGAYRTLLMGAAVGAYMGFLVDGIVNYPSELSRIQKATTLSMVCPGAGQVYNGSYWKVPIVVGGLASMFYVIDWNSRGYNRFKIAYAQITDGDDSTVDEFGGRYTEKQIQNYKNLYRRNRDLAIIGLVGVYLVQVADAHIDAHMQAYDITDDLVMKIQPYVNTVYTRSGYANNIGMNMALYF